MNKSKATDPKISMDRLGLDEGMINIFWKRTLILVLIYLVFMMKLIKIWYVDDRIQYNITLRTDNGSDHGFESSKNNIFILYDNNLLFIKN